MNKILLAIDGSAYDEKSVHFINEKLAWAQSMEVYVVTVLPEMDETLLHVYPGLREEYTAQAEKRLQEIAQMLTIHANTCQRRVLEGPVAEQLLTFAEQIGVDMIVMGCRGLSNYEELTLGSVSMKVIRLSPRPVVIVK
ncbi:universal stress protein [Aneurinibacillus danicus]|jgi:nucleotide-binding universal stress UspA family protein|uniref:Universal stress protein n=1 Tax=Aneurinibacillus danicus TaxID=267746 RepID=A0A511V514_9BACL|nr:universal stress protein [Aneurinibacillus danicus]GEN34014.1 universal stress protein [Aneurinibacillus danicus]